MNFKKMFSCKKSSSNRYYLLKQEFKKQKLEIEDLKEQNNTLQTQMSKIDFSMFHEIEDIKHESKSLHKKYKKLKHKYLSSKNNTN